MAKLTLNKTPNSVVIEIQTKEQTPRQAMALKSMIADGNISSAIEYLESLAGKRRYLNVNRLKSLGTDKLADKEAGSVLSMFERMTDLEKGHKPTNSETDWIGVEIECLIPEFEPEFETCPRCDGSGEIDSDGEMTECHRCDGDGQIETSESDMTQLQRLLRGEKVRLTNLKRDGSIREESGYFGAEITVLTRLSRPENLKRVCELLNNLGAKVNKSCGMHVHLDARHLDAKAVKAIGAKFKKVLPVMGKMVPESRRENSFCRLDVSGLTGSRYFAVNLTAFKKYRTVEIRLHSSTTDFNKIIQWATLLSCVFKAEKIKAVCHDLNTLTEYVRLPEETLEYLTQRIDLFSGGSTPARFADNDSTQNAEAV